MKKLKLAIVGLIFASSSFASVSATTNEKEGLVTTTVKTDEKNGLVTKTQEMKEETVGKIISLTLNTDKEDYELEIAFKLIAKCLENKMLNNKNLIRNVNVTSNENSSKKVISFELVTEKNQKKQLDSFVKNLFNKKNYEQNGMKKVLKEAIDEEFNAGNLDELIKDYEKNISDKIKSAQNRQKMENLNIFNIFNNISSFFNDDREDKEIRERIEEFKINKLEQTKTNLKNLSYKIDKEYLKEFVDSIVSMSDGGSFEKQGASYFSSTVKE